LFASAALASLLLVAAPLVAAQSAVAAAEDCSEGSVCVWTGPDFTGPMAETSRPTAACVTGVSRSAVNHSADLTVVLWSGADCSGESAMVAPGETISVADPPWRSVEVVPVPPRCLIATLLCS
jgi:hypothetical protein